MGLGFGLGLGSGFVLGLGLGSGLGVGVGFGLGGGVLVHDGRARVVPTEDAQATWLGLGTHRLPG